MMSCKSGRVRRALRCRVGRPPGRPFGNTLRRLVCVRGSHDHIRPESGLTTSFWAWERHEIIRTYEELQALDSSIDWIPSLLVCYHSQRTTNPTELVAPP